MLRRVLGVGLVLLVSTGELERGVKSRTPHTAGKVHPINVRRGRRGERPRYGRVQLVTAGLSRLSRLAGLMVLWPMLTLLLTLLLLTLLRLLTGLRLLSRLSHVLSVLLGRTLLRLGVRRLLGLLVQNSGGSARRAGVRSRGGTGRLLLLRLNVMRCRGGLRRGGLSGLETVHGGGLDRGRRVTSPRAARASRASAGAAGRRRRRRLGRRDPPVVGEAVHWPLLATAAQTFR